MKRIPQMKLMLAATAMACFAACTPVKQAPIDFVNPMIGTGFHGHTYPGATVPFGAVQLSPDTRRGNWDACAGYHYSDATLDGFSHTHLSGTGCIDLGDILFRPTTALRQNSDSLYGPAAFSHSNEQVTPGYYRVQLTDEEITAELTATLHTGVHRYTFPKDQNAWVVVDAYHSLDNEHIYETSLAQTADNELTGMRRSRGWTDNQYVYFVAQFSQPFTADPAQLKEGRVVALDFGKATDQPLVARVGISAVSADNARKNIEAEMTHFDFDLVKEQAGQQWAETLNVVQVEGGNEADRTNFYTALYHTLIVPNTMSDANGQYRRSNMEIGTCKQGGQYYSTFSLWDTFRAWHPLMTLIDTRLVNNMVNSLLDMYQATGELPIWPLSAGETRCMIGYHSASVIADAYLKGIRGFDAELALEAMVKSSEINQKGADYYIRLGYIPANARRESVSCLLEYAYDDWCIAQMAKAMGKEDIYKTYIERSQNYVNVFDGSTCFFRGKREDGNWETPFNPFAIGRAYTEATAWQYRYFVPHDVQGMAHLFGGSDALAAALDSLYAADSRLDGEQADITGLIGQYAHGNEPSHHIAYLYSYVGQPWKTQAMTRRLLDELYQPTPEGISGNEDCGQMSAWYVLSALGFYSVCPGSNEFVLTTPLFDKTVIRLANGKSLTIVANNPGKNHYIGRVSLNGQEITKNFLTYEQLMQGGELQFELTAQPDMQRGTALESAPYSYTTEAVASIPSVTTDLNMFMDSVSVNLVSATPGASIHYTLNGNEPTETSPLYTAPFVVKQSTLIKAIACKEGMRPSRSLQIKATKARPMAALQRQCTVQGVNYQYFEGNCQKVADIDRLSPLKQGVIPQPTIADAAVADHFAYIFSGYIRVPESGVYGFQTLSDDGSVLYIGNELVVNNDGGHSAIASMGNIALEAGIHPFRILYFEDYEGEEFSWAWQLPSGIDYQPIPAEALFAK